MNAEQDWRTRLMDCLHKDVRSPRGISLQAGLGENYLTQMIRDSKEPRFEIVSRLCKVLDVSITYVVTGNKLSKLDEEILELLSEVDIEAKKHFRDFLKLILARSGNSDFVDLTLVEKLGSDFQAS